ncbi:MAG TPA: SDR family oxidoreductase [Burkholderiaceae bacterium]|nr:SDR family oxidoreductase [Burkholderiaceae bacterium]
MSISLVTGGAGFIGSHIVRRLLKDGKQVRVLDDFSTGHRHNLAEVERHIHLVEGDIRDPDAARSACRNVDVVYHLAAQGSVPKSVDDPFAAHDRNITGTLNMLLAARDAGVRRFVYSSSSSAYGETPTLPKVESMKPDPRSPYAVSKLAAEQYCSVFAYCYGMQTISLRYFNVFGPRQDPNSQYAAAIPGILKRMLRGERPIIYGDGEQSRDFCYVDNVVQANRLAAEAARLGGEAVNIGCGERTTLNEIIRLINEHLGTRLQPDYQPPRAGDVKHSLASIDEARRVIGYEPQVFFAEGLKRSIAWFKENL